jgi:hypothetical protein
MGRWATLALAAGLTFLGGSWVRAEALDPSLSIALAVGPSPGRAPSERLDAHRTGRTRTRLPDKPVEAWRRQLGPLDLPPLVDKDGAVLALLTTPEVVKLSADGKEIWRQRIGTSPAVVPAVFTSDGTLVLVTGAGHAVGLGPSGRILFDVPLALRVTDKDSAPVALTDGGVVVGAGRTLVVLDRDGGARARTTMTERVAGLFLGVGNEVLFTSEDGTLYGWRAPSLPRRIGSFGGSPRQGAILLDARASVAVVDQRGIVSLDLSTPTTDSFDAPPAVGVGAQVIAMTASGDLVFVDAVDDAKHAPSLERRASAAAANRPATSGRVVGGAESKASPAAIVDADGRVVFVRARGRVGVVRPDGGVFVATERVCGAPIAILPAAERAILVACHDGAIVWLGE